MLMLTTRGITLTEILVASALAAVIAIGIATLEGSRAKVEQEVIRESGVASDQGAVALATIGMAQRITQADRVVINNGTGVFQFRAPVGCMAGVPAPNCFDNAANFGWDQYRLTGGQLRLYTNTGAGCGNLQNLANNVTGLSFAYIDFASAPPDGWVPDNNLIEYAVTWLESGKDRQFRGRVVSRAVAYSNVNATGNDSGSGMAPTGIAPPPAACP